MEKLTNSAARNRNTNNNDGNFTTEQVMRQIAENRTSVRRTVEYFNHIWGHQLDAEDVQDAVQVTIQKALEACEWYNPQRASLPTWLGRIAKNVVLDRCMAKMRKRTVETSYIDEADDEGFFDDGIRQLHFRLDANDNPSSKMETLEAKRLSRLRIACFRKAILALSERDQQVIRMLLLGMTGKQMAQALQLMECTQRKRVHDVRQRLKRKLNEFHYSDLEARLSRQPEAPDCPEEDDDEVFGHFFAVSRTEECG